ncbi:cell division protein [Klebsiella michiganensis]|nr:cell division protein [Klebsiella michiganensis]
MLYSAPNSTIPVRVHGAFVRDEEVHAVVQDWKARGRPQYVDGITSDSESEGGGGGYEGGEELDPLFDQAVNFVTEKRKASISGYSVSSALAITAPRVSLSKWKLRGS